MSKTYLRKSLILEIILLFLSRKIKDIENSIEQDENKIILDKIRKDLRILAKYERFKKIDFYYNCLDIINNYY